MKRDGETSPFVRSHAVTVCDVSNPTQGLSDEFDCAVGTAEPDLLVRVGQTLSSIASARALSDAEILQHAADCTRLMEGAYQRFEETQDPEDRQESVRWMVRRDQARQSLSVAWKDQREAQLQQRLCGDYFVEQGDAARARLVGGRD